MSATISTTMVEGAQPVETTKPVTTTKHLGMRVNGKQWHEPKKAFRPTSGLTPYAKRAKDRVTHALVKAKENEMKEEKEAERKRKIIHMKEKREAKEEKARYALIAEKVHKKRVERLKRKEKRNKLLNS